MEEVDEEEGQKEEMESWEDPEMEEDREVKEEEEMEDDSPETARPKPRTLGRMTRTASSTLDRRRRKTRTRRTLRITGRKN